jgi:hypothetical protein
VASSEEIKKSMYREIGPSSEGVNPFQTTAMKFIDLIDQLIDAKIEESRIQNPKSKIQNG